VNLYRVDVYEVINRDAQFFIRAESVEEAEEAAESLDLSWDEDVIDRGVHVQGFSDPPPPGHRVWYGGESGQWATT
jgi:alkanesulfonate monooxygenase SsuD/methylene tetrahydromethanopterin reductase-like flavin-dependent oxidoreductase (luciferase family)